MKKYHDLLQQSQQEKEAQEIQFQVEEAKQSLESDILATKRSLANTQRELIKYKSTFPLNTKQIVHCEVEIEGYHDGLKKLEALREELF
jgi:hypothetical protein